MNLFETGSRFKGFGGIPSLTQTLPPLFPQDATERLLYMKN